MTRVTADGGYHRYTGGLVRDEYVNGDHERERHFLIECDDLRGGYKPKACEPFPARRAAIALGFISEDVWEEREPRRAGMFIRAMEELNVVGWWRIVVVDIHAENI